MWYLYDRDTNTKLDVSDKEQDILNTMGEYYQTNTYYRFTIVKYDEITTEPSWRSIRNIGEYEAYIQEYNARQLKNKTCVELKREILDLSGTKAPKNKKFTFL